MKIPNYTSKTLGLCITGALTCSLAAFAADVTWTGGGASQTDWTLGTNWSGGVEPTSSTGNSGDVLQFDTTANHAIYDGSFDAAGDGTGGASYYRAIRVGYNASGRLDVTGGLLIQDDSIEARIGRGSGRTGTVNVSGGELRLSAGKTQIGLDGGSTGVLNVSGTGTATLGRETGGLSAWIGAGGNGSVTVSDSAVFQTRAGVILGDNGGTGNFFVNGADATIDIGGYQSVDGEWTQNAGSTLGFGVDGANGISRVLISDDTTIGGTFALFGSGSFLDVGFLGETIGGSWVVMEVENGDITDSGLALAAGVDTEVWSFSIDNSGANGLLTITAVPEPSTYALLAGLAVLSLISVRRRK